MPISWLVGTGHGLPEPYAEAYTDTEAWADANISANVTLRCPWANRHGILQNILYGQKEWPYVPGSNIRAMTGGVRPAPSSKTVENGNANDYIDAFVDIAFQFAIQKDNAPGGGQAIYSESLEPTAEFLTIPHQDFRWGSTTGAALKKEEAPGRLEIGMDYIVTWNGLTQIPSQALTLIGCVNNGNVFSPSLGLSFPSETLLFNPPKISRTVNSSGSGRFQMTCRLTYRAAGWNQFWRAETAKFERMYFRNAQPATKSYNNFQLSSMAGVLP